MMASRRSKFLAGLRTLVFPTEGKFTLDYYEAFAVRQRNAAYPNLFDIGRIRSIIVCDLFL